MRTRRKILLVHKTYKYGTECSEKSAYKIHSPEITQKKEHDVQNMAEICNPE